MYEGSSHAGLKNSTPQAAGKQIRSVGDSQQHLNNSSGLHGPGVQDHEASPGVRVSTSLRSGSHEHNLQLPCCHLRPHTAGLSDIGVYA